MTNQEELTQSSILSDTFLVSSIVTEEDILKAIEEWKNNPPDKEFENILEAEIEAPQNE